MADWTPEAIQKTVDDLVKRSMTDADFRKTALADPAQAVRIVAGIDPPPGVTIKFFDGTGAQIALVLPEMAKEDASELSDLELEQVAGGRGACAVTCVGASCAVTSTVTIGIPGIGCVLGI
jgi:hypothetical protein